MARVLLVGKDVELLKLYSLALHLRGGYEVHYATPEDVESFVTRADGLQAVVFDFSVVDEQMEAVAKRTLNMVHCVSVALVYSVEDVRKCRTLGFDFVKQKPILISSLVELVKSCEGSEEGDLATQKLFEK